MAAEVAPDDRLTLDQQICFTLAVAYRDVVSLYRPLLEPLGLTHPQYLVMVTLWEHPKTLCVKDLSVNRPGKSGDSVPWEGWSHVREYVEEVPGRPA